jgi:hypothetical protein
MSRNLLDVPRETQDELRETLWEIMNQQGSSVHAFSRELRVTHQTLASFFRGANLTRKIEMRLRYWLERYEDGDIPEKETKTETNESKIS